jgi:hypothetical protein
LLTTWQNRESRLLTAAGYQLTGGIHAAVIVMAERAFARLNPPGQATARRLLLMLVNVDRHAGQTQLRRTTDQLREQLPGEELGVVLAAFVQARLLTTPHHDHRHGGDHP